MSDNENSVAKTDSKPKRRYSSGKIPVFCVGVVVGVVVVIGLMAYGGILATSAQALWESSEIDIIELEETIKACSELTITKFNYAGLAFDKDKKRIPTPIGKLSLPFTEDSSLVAYKGTIGLGFDISALEPKADTQSKTITIKLPEIGILYNEFDNANTQSFVLKNDVFSREKNFGTSNALIKRLKSIEEKSVLKNEAVMNEARTNAENVIRSTISGWDATSDYKVVFK